MSRLGRYFAAGQPLHVLQRGIDHRQVFLAPDDYARYRDWLLEAAVINGCAIHAYALMPNHVHFFGRAERRGFATKNDAVARATLCSLCQLELWAIGYDVGGAVSCSADRSGHLLLGLQPIYRDESGAR